MTKSIFLAVIFVFPLALFFGSTFSQGTDVLKQNGKRIVGYLDDSLLAKRWAVMQDDTRPEAPRTLVPVESAAASARRPVGIKSMTADPRQNVVHAGDRLTLLDDSATLHMQLAAVAVESAIQGGRLRVRLVQGGTILSAIVLSPHRVKLLGFAGSFAATQGAIR